MTTMASQITSLTVVYSTVYLGADPRKHQSSASLDFVRGIHRGPVNSPRKWPVTRKMFPFDDVIMCSLLLERHVWIRCWVPSLGAVTGLFLSKRNTKHSTMIEYIARHSRRNCRYSVVKNLAQLFFSSKASPLGCVFNHAQLPMITSSSTWIACRIYKLTVMSLKTSCVIKLHKRKLNYATYMYAAFKMLYSFKRSILYTT